MSAANMLSPPQTSAAPSGRTSSAVITATRIMVLLPPLGRHLDTSCRGDLRSHVGPRAAAKPCAASISCPRGHHRWPLDKKYDAARLICCPLGNKCGGAASRRGGKPLCGQAAYGVWPQSSGGPRSAWPAAAIARRLPAAASPLQRLRRHRRRRYRHTTVCVAVCRRRTQLLGRFAASNWAA